jgi:predicted metal-dependent hydrolase
MEPADPPVPPTERLQFRTAERLHNEGEFYEAHEAWEEIWTHEGNDEWRIFVQGLIQVTSAFHKLFFQREPRGASRLLERGLEKLDRYPPDYLGVAVGSFRDASRALLPRMSTLEPKTPAIDTLRPLVPKLTRVH